ncbi:MAG: glutathione S-transferase family protein [Rickettsiaceae bacterium]|nr:glutathione S-transferase family protein [Rickettsiaceae bacterium]
MQKLYHHPMCPLSRQVRIYLKEFNKEFTLINEPYWTRREEFVKINPASTLPVLQLDSMDYSLVGIYAISEYISETQENFYFMPSDPIMRAEARRYMSWFNEKFYREVSKVLVDEKMIRLLMSQGEPRSGFIMTAKSNITQHLNFLTALLKKNTYIISEQITCADIAAAAHISIVDYFGEINWNRWSTLKEWYSILKSRPSFQPLLQDRIAGFNPSSEYSNLDF